MGHFLFDRDVDVLRCESPARRTRCFCVTFRSDENYPKILKRRNGNEEKDNDISPSCGGSSADIRVQYRGDNDE